MFAPFLLVRETASWKEKNPINAKNLTFLPGIQLNLSNKVTHARNYKSGVTLLGIQSKPTQEAKVFRVCGIFFLSALCLSA